jgi:hypothetical protein
MVCETLPNECESLLGDAIYMMRETGVLLYREEIIASPVFATYTLCGALLFIVCLFYVFEVQAVRI